MPKKILLSTVSAHNNYVVVKFREMSWSWQISYDWGVVKVKQKQNIWS